MGHISKETVIIMGLDKLDLSSNQENSRNDNLWKRKGVKSGEDKLDGKEGKGVH